jgi:hypothetical protein
MVLIGLLMIRNTLLLPITLIYILVAIVVIFLKMLCRHYIKVEAGVRTFMPHTINQIKRSLSRKKKRKERK